MFVKYCFVFTFREGSAIFWNVPGVEVVMDITIPLSQLLNTESFSFIKFTISHVVVIVLLNILVINFIKLYF